jgi:ACS family hexuronate transporter-like MFS transporter
MLGFSEAGNWPGATKSNAEWFPSKERAIAQGIFGAGASLGSVVAAPFIAYLYLAFGWRMTFVGIGCVGLLWIIPWLLINKNVPSNTHGYLRKSLHIYKGSNQQQLLQMSHL